MRERKENRARLGVQLTRKFTSTASARLAERRKEILNMRQREKGGEGGEDKEREFRKTPIGVCKRCAFTTSGNIRVKI